MTIPDELVQAAAGALATKWPADPYLRTPEASARIALQAAFAKLGECEATELAVLNALASTSTAQGHALHWREAKEVLAALACMWDDHP